VRLVVISHQGALLSKSIFTERYTRFRLLLAEARQAAGLTQEELAAKLGRNQSFVSNYERGQRRIDVVEFLEVAKALGIDPCEVIRQLSDG
jgi:transcriptional regulator with XRE-family HTH domain